MSDIRFYKYFFIGLDKPIIMEAANKAIADQMLRQLSINSKVKINLNKLIDLRIETPIFGISTKKRKGNDYVWVGIDKTSDGWLIKEEYDKLEKLKQQQNK